MKPELKLLKPTKEKLTLDERINQCIDNSYTKELHISEDQPESINKLANKYVNQLIKFLHDDNKKYPIIVVDNVNPLTIQRILKLHKKIKICLSMFLPGYNFPISYTGNNDQEFNLMMKHMKLIYGTRYK